MIRGLTLLVCLAAFAQPNTLQDPAWNKPISAGGGGGGGSVSFAYASTATQAQGSQTTITNTITTGGSHSSGYAAVGFANWENRTITSVTFNGVACSKLTNIVDSASVNLSLWGVGIGSLAAGTYDAVVTYSAAVSEWCIGVVTFNGAAQTQAEGNGITASGTSTTPSTSLTLSTGEMLIGASMNYGNVSLAVGADQTQRWTGGQSAFTTAICSTEGGTGSVTHSYTLGGSTAWTILAYAIKP